MESANGASQEYWRPAQRVELEQAFPGGCCANCGTEFAVGARFCHVCGSARVPVSSREWQLPGWLDFNTISDHLGLNLASLLLLVIACACAIGAVLTGVVYKATTVLEWQAVQTWRIEWLLASMVALLAAILLKKSNF